MQNTVTWDLREAEAGIDDATIASVMVEYLEWAHVRLLELYGVDHPPTDPHLVSQSLPELRRPHGVLLLAECDGRPAGEGRGGGERRCSRRRAGTAKPRATRGRPGGRVSMGRPPLAARTGQR